MKRSSTPSTGRAPASSFTGEVYITPVAVPEPPSRLFAAHVHFAPGARTNWHSHPGGQTLFVTEGVGLVGTRDGRLLRILPGDTVSCPPDEEHWHGATPTTLMSHLVMMELRDDAEQSIWLEPVTDEQFRAAPTE
jgi:quercetin dioxygenase-like cupin family protein